MARAKPPTDAKVEPETPRVYFSINPRLNCYSSPKLSWLLQVLPREPPQEPGRGWFAGSYQLSSDNKALGIVVTDAYSTGFNFTGASRFAFVVDKKGVLEGPKDAHLDILVGRLFSPSHIPVTQSEAESLKEAQEEIDRIRRLEEKRYRLSGFGD